ncbi:MAG: O-antigen polymerase [Actinomycetota bacterium]
MVLFLAGALNLSLSWLVWLSGAVLFGLFYWLRITGWRDWGDPIFFYPALVWVTFGLVALLPRPPATDLVILQLQDEHLIASYGFVLLGLACYMLAYALVARPSEQVVIRGPEVAAIHRKRFLLVLLVVTGARVGLMLAGRGGYLLSAESYESSLSYAGFLIVISEVSPFLLALAALIAFSRSGTTADRLLFVALIVLELISGFITGTKSGLVLPTIAAALGYLYACGRMPWKRLGAIFLIFLFLVPGIEEYREQLNVGDRRVDTVTEAIELMPEAIKEMFVGDLASDRVTRGFDMLVGRLDELRAMSVIYAATPERIPYEYGKNYFGAPLYTVIPRALWPGKPELGRIGFETGRDYWGITTQTSIARTIFGDLYANFGILGIVGGMLIYGVVSGILRRRFVIRRDVRSFLIYALVFFTLLNHESDFASILAGFPRTLVVVLVLGWFIVPAREKERETNVAPQAEVSVA